VRQSERRYLYEGGLHCHCVAAAARKYTELERKRVTSRRHQPGCGHIFSQTLVGVCIEAVGKL